MRKIVWVLLFIPFIGFTQNNCKCCSENHKSFDFWVGDWLVYDTSGTQIGESTIIKQEDNCIVNEHWRGAKGTTGRSYNYFNRKDSTWNQVWIDNQGSNLVLKGKASTNKMVLKSELLKGKKIPLYANQITWTKMDDGTVTQVWHIIDEQDKVLKELFRGIYKKKDL